MPIRFQCPTCEGTLSIARRKAGTQVLCPKCEDIIMVPDEDDSSDVELADSTAGSTAAGPTSAVAKPPPRSTKSKKPGDSSISEIDDIEDLLDDAEPAPEPAVAKRSAPLPLPPQPIPNVGPEDGILVSREVAIILGIVMLVLLALSFITGFMIGR